MRLRFVLASCLCSMLVACVRPAEERAERDLEVGEASGSGLGVHVKDGLAAVRALAANRLVLWSSAPGFELSLDAQEPRTISVEIRNVTRTAELVPVEGGPEPLSSPGGTLPTERRYVIELPAGTSRFALTAPGAKQPGAFRFALLSDVQEAIVNVQDIFQRMNQEADIEFLLGAGDLTQGGSVEELERYQRELRSLFVPYYTTLGNHELGVTPPPYQDLFGRASFHFVHRGVAFTLLDSGSATLDPLVDDWLDGWLASARSQVHVVAMHIPPLDPIGVRNGAFASRAEAAALLGRLAAGGVDLTLYGHIHSYYSFDNAGIPAFISGGGGALPERFDHIGRHFMLIDVDAALGITATQVVRVD